MEKSKQQTTSYKGISANESYLSLLVKENDIVVFGVKEIQRLSNWNKNRVHNTLCSLERKGLLKRVKRDSYIFSDALNEKLFRIATELVKPSYITFWTALSFYGFTEQQVKTVQLVSTKQVDSMAISPFKIETVTFNRKRFYGYKKIEDFVIATPEKALVDSLYQINKCGGLDEFGKCLQNAWNTLNKKALVDYLIRFGNKSLISRAGFIIDQLSLEKTKDVDKLSKYKSKTPVKLDPSRKKHGKHNQSWNILINHEIKLEEIR